MPNGFLVSSFDLFNVGDLDLISQARSMCGRLVVAVMSDEAVAAATGWNPVVPAVGRAALMRHVRGVDDVIIVGADEPRWGAGSTDLVMTSGLAEQLRDGDVVLVAGRRSSSTLLSKLIVSGPAVASVGVA